MGVTDNWNEYTVRVYPLHIHHFDPKIFCTCQVEAENNGPCNEVIAHTFGEKYVHFTEQVTKLLLKEPVTSAITCRLISAPVANCRQKNLNEKLNVY